MLILLIYLCISYRKVKKIAILTSGELVGLVVPHPPDKIEVGDVIRDNVGGVGSGHVGWVFALFALSRRVVVLIGD